MTLILKHLSLSVLILSIVMGTTGCASFGQRLKAFLGGKPQEQPQQQVQQKPTRPHYSDNPNVLAGPRRQYRRMTRTRMEEEALLSGQAGSLWVMEGQGAYLFSQNIMRMIGDPIAVVIEGEPREQLQSKVDVIAKLLARLEKRMAMRQPAARPGPTAAPPQEGGQGTEDAQAAQVEETPKYELNVRNVPTRVVERTTDGNYRVKGSQPFMIGTREYQIIVTGIVRAEDFNEEGISATKLIDPKFDVVSNRRREG